MGVARAEREARERGWAKLPRIAAAWHPHARWRKGDGTRRALAGCMRCGGKRVSASGSDTFHSAGHKYKISVSKDIGKSAVSRALNSRALQLLGRASGVWRRS